MKTVVVSGYFNPLHVGHVRYLEAARLLGDRLVVIVNNDHQVKLKGAVPFMSCAERMEVVAALSCVSEVVESIDTGRSVALTLTKVGGDIFANGGDRNSEAEIPEAEVCRALGIEMAFNVGGGKIQSSSWLIGNATKDPGAPCGNSSTCPASGSKSSA